jgi:hypothetical protein
MARRLLLQGASIIDGSGAPARAGDALLEDGSIAEVLTTTLPPDEVVDARGKLVAPGFVDMDSHSDFSLPVDREAQAMLLQGVTTEVVGNCGLGLTLRSVRRFQCAQTGAVGVKFRRKPSPLLRSPETLPLPRLLQHLPAGRPVGGRTSTDRRARAVRAGPRRCRSRRVLACNGTRREA